MNGCEVRLIIYVDAGASLDGFVDAVAGVEAQIVQYDAFRCLCGTV